MTHVIKEAEPLSPRSKAEPWNEKRFATQTKKLHECIANSYLEQLRFFQANFSLKFNPAKLSLNLNRYREKNVSY
jgi:hypothetical protein